MSNMCASMHILLIALMMIQSGLAIKCINCDSQTNERCANMSDPHLVAEECNYGSQIDREGNYNYNNNRHWLLRISDFREKRLPNEVDVKMICQKLIGIDEHKQRTVVRRCQVASPDPCNFTRIATVNLNRYVECYKCQYDGCNGTSSNQVFGMMIGFVLGIAILKEFIF